MITIKEEAIKEGKDLEENGILFNRYYAEHLLEKGKTVYYWDYPKRTYVGITKENVSKYPLYDKNRYIDDSYASDKMFTSEFVDAVYTKKHTEEKAYKSHLAKLIKKSACLIKDIGQNELVIKYFFR